ncbi:Ig-like domain-containing protein [Oceanicaulis sp. UBA2681]|uniref:Ig-like domain-containing protein n=1 Tax=Oceanicaulis sp. UBA2681 TaxID=1947007 RepID=UPI00257FA030|nr:Ig-like domain-containing protein [Oceanicaulis sp. UBA2681]
MLSRLHRTIATGAIASLIALTGTAASLAQQVFSVTLRTDGSCTASNPTIFDVRAYIPTSTTNDTGDGRDLWHYYLLDHNKTVLGRNSIAITIPYANPNAIRSVATNADPAVGLFTVMLRNEDAGFDLNVGDTADTTASLVRALYQFNASLYDSDCPGLPDTTAPRPTSIVRQTPAAEATNADSLTWRVSFDEAMQNVDAADFAVTGTTASLSVNAVSTSVYDVTASGGNLADLSDSASHTTVSLGFSAGRDLTDLASNALSSTTPSGAHEHYNVNNLAPVLAGITRAAPSQELTNSDALIWEFEFSQIPDSMSLTAADFTLTGTTASLVVNRYPDGFNVTATGGDLANLNGTVSISLKNGFVTEYGNAMATGAPSGTNDNSFVVDNAAPTVTSIDLYSGTTTPTGADVVSWLVTFNEAMNPSSITSADFQVSGTTATPTVSHVTDSTYEISLANGDIATMNGSVALSFAPGAAMSDTVGNALVSTTVNGTNNNTIQMVNDSAAPTVTSIVRSTPATENTNADSLTWRVSFSELVRNVSADDFTVSGTTATVTTVDTTSSPGAFASPASASPSGSPSSASFLVTASGGDLASVADSTVSLGLSSSHNITDDASNSLTVTTPSGANESYNVRNAAPVLASITQNTPTALVTNADSLTWDFNFSEISDSMSLAPSDFTLTGTTATLSVTRYSIGFYVTASGGDLADLDGMVRVVLNNGIVDDYGNAMATAVPTGTYGNSYFLDNTAPTIASVDLDPGTVSPTDADTVSWRVTFSEELPQNQLTAADLVITGTTATPTITHTLSKPDYYLVTLANGDLANLNGSVSLAIAPGNSITDSAGNALTGTRATGVNNNTIVMTNDAEAPSVTLSSSASRAVTGAFSVTIQFSEAVNGFSADGLSVSNGVVSSFNAVSPAQYTAEIKPSADGPVTVEVRANATSDVGGNGNTASNSLSVMADTAAPTASLSASIGDIASGPFDLTITFSEPVSGFALDDLAVIGAVASDLTGSGATYSATVTPDGADTVTVSLAAGAAMDAAGNGSLATEDFSVKVDADAPSPVLSGPGETVEGAFALSIEFGEPVTGFALESLSFTNADATDLVSLGEGRYSVTVTPRTVGSIEITLAAGAAKDAAGNGSLGAVLSVEVVAPPTEVVVEVTAETADPTTVSAGAKVTNPGSQAIPFRAFADVDWLIVTPDSGVVPPLGDIDFTVEVTDAVNDLPPGDYTGTVTVVRESASGTSSASAPSASIQETIIIEIPISLSLEPRYGSLTLVASTASGLSGDASFTYASDIADFDGLTLTPRTGSAQAEISELMSGTYTLTQSIPQGWRVNAISCAGDLDGGSSFDAEQGVAVIDLDPDEALVCTFENARDEDLVRLATQRAIRNFMLRRADRLIDAAPDLSHRFEARETTQRGAFAAQVEGSGRYQMSLAGSLAGARNAAAQTPSGMNGPGNPERPVLENWDVWFAAELSGVSDNRAGERASSDFGVAQLGADYQLSDDLIVGALLQYDWMDERAGEIFAEAGALRGARTEGQGWMVGPYTVWRMTQSLTLDAMALYGQSDNTVDPLGFYQDDFETDRLMVRANLSGEVAKGPWRLRPQAGITHFEERQKGYVDSLGFDIPEQSVALGRFRAGPEIAWRRETSDGGWLEVNTSVAAVWDYRAAELINEQGGFNGGDALRADARIGVAAQTGWGARVQLETGLSGLGVGDFEARSTRIEIRIPFGARSAGGGGSLNRFASEGPPAFNQACLNAHSGFEQAVRGQAGCL